MDTMIANHIYAVITPFMKADVLAVTIALIMYFVVKRIIIIKQIVAVKYYRDAYKAMLDSITKRFVIDLPVIDDSLNLPAEPIDDKTFTSHMQGCHCALYMPHQGHVYRINIDDVEEIVLNDIGAREVRHIGDSYSMNELAVLINDGVRIAGNVIITQHSDRGFIRFINYQGGEQVA